MAKKNKPKEQPSEGTAPAKKPIDYTPRRERQWRELNERTPWPPGQKQK